MSKHIAVVGGGIAGIYTAWRLLQHNQSEEVPRFVVHLYESDERLGGRIRSEKIPGTHFSAELGAMRFRPSHKLLNSLLAHLDIPTSPFDLPPTAFYVRGRRLMNSEITAGRCDSCNAEGPFLLKESERGLSAVQLVSHAIDSILQALDFPALREGDARQLKARIKKKSFDARTWYKIKNNGTYKGLHLYSIGFWNLLQHFLSNEAYVMVHDVLSLESILGNWNAAEAIPWFLTDFASDQFDMVPGGLSRVANKLRLQLDDLGAKTPGSLRLLTSHKVEGLKRDDNKWQVIFAKSICGADTVSEAQQYDHSYDWVILALPKSGLEAIDVQRHSNQDVVPNHRKSSKDWPPKWVHWVSGHRMFKLFLLYDEPWWIGDGVPGGSDGRVFTDLPLRQVYYFSPTWMCKHGLHNQSDATQPRHEEEVRREGLSLIMASYSDEHYVSFWEPLLKPRPELGLIVNPGLFHLLQSSEIKEDEWQSIVRDHGDVLATRRMVDKVHGLLNEIHGREVPQPILGVVRDWDAGWHTWVVGSRPWEEIIRGERVEPFYKEGLFLCGEAYSTEQGWIEGALKSAEQVLKELLGVKSTKSRYERGTTKPDWLNGVQPEDFDDYIGCWDWKSVEDVRSKGDEERAE